MKNVKALLKQWKRTRLYENVKKMRYKGLTTAEIAKKLHMSIYDLNMEFRFAAREDLIRKGNCVSLLEQKEVEEYAKSLRTGVDDFGFIPVDLGIVTSCFNADRRVLDEAIYILEQEGFDKEIHKVILSNGREVLCGFLVDKRKKGDKS